MKNNEVYLLLNKGIIPDHLVDGWNTGPDLKRYEPKNAKRKVLWEVSLARILFVLNTLTILLGPNVLHHYHYDPNQSVKIIFCFLWVMILVMIYGIWQSILQEDNYFGDRLEKLSELLGMGLRDLIKASENEVKGRARTRLISRASMILYAEKTFGIESKSAEELRKWFKRCHQICFVFRLVDAKVDPYYAEASLDNAILSPANKGWIADLEKGKKIDKLQTEHY